jgi:hypothetical protein
MLTVMAARKQLSQAILPMTMSMTVPILTSNPPSCRKPHRCGKCDDCDGPDDEMQRFSKGVQQLICVTTPPIIVGLTILSIALAEESQSMEL